MVNRLIAVLLFITFLVLVTIPFAHGGLFSQHKRIKATNGEVAIPLKTINNGQAHYFVYKSKGQEVKFFVVKSRDGVIRAAFDACDVCYLSKKGYSQDGEFMICNNCGRRFHSSRINVVKGGCNPAPLNRVERDGMLVLQVKDILSGARYF